MPDTPDGAWHLEGSRFALRTDQDETVAEELDEVTGRLHSFETGGTLDGPGVRFVAFLTGCHFRCQYCHNPDTWRAANGKRVTVQELMATIEGYADFLIKYNGGVTLSGGEVLVQDRFAANLLRRCKERGLHTALDTNGYLGDKVTPQMMADVDLWLLDIKSFDPDVHRKVTGADVEPVLKFARRLSDEGRPMWVRFVLVPGLTDDIDNVEGLAEFTASLEGVERVEVLPFHQMGAYKWRELGLDYKLADTQAPDQALIERVQHQFAARGLFVL